MSGVRMVAWVLSAVTVVTMSAPASAAEIDPTGTIDRPATPARLCTSRAVAAGSMS
ncbi:hypothetical protein D3C86_1167870 [compost metagenome]